MPPWSDVAQTSSVGSFVARNARPRIRPYLPWQPHEQGDHGHRCARLRAGRTPWRQGRTPRPVEPDPRPTASWVIDGTTGRPPWISYPPKHPLLGRVINTHSVLCGTEIVKDAYLKPPSHPHVETWCAVIGSHTRAQRRRTGAGSASTSLRQNEHRLPVCTGTHAHHYALVVL